MRRAIDEIRVRIFRAAQLEFIVASQKLESDCEHTLLYRDEEKQKLPNLEPVYFTHCFSCDKSIGYTVQITVPTLEQLIG